MNPPQHQPARRTPGAWKGKGWIAPDFDETDPEIIDAMENGPVFPDESQESGSAHDKL